MPEGDTIHRLAGRLHAALAGRVVRRMHADAPRLAGADLVGRRVEAVRAHGKHLLMHFQGGGVLHSHMRMRGRWSVRRGGLGGRPRRRVEVLLEFDGVSACCENAPLVEYVNDLNQATWLGDLLKREGKLPPDPLADDFESRIDEAISRLRRPPALTIEEAIMDQTRVAGIGNEYKSELLFIARLDPSLPVDEVTDDALRELLTSARSWMRRNLVTGGRRRTRHGGGPPGWVYGRTGQRCLVCDARIVRTGRERSGRSTYACPECQVSRTKG